MDARLDRPPAAVTIYLNESADAVLGFDPATARLRIAARFTVAAPSSAQDAAASLEQIYTQLNIGGDVVAATDYTRDYRAAGNRSLSMGDVVVLGETAFTVARFGFDIISSAALATALVGAAS